MKTKLLKRLRKEAQDNSTIEILKNDIRVTTSIRGFLRDVHCGILMPSWTPMAHRIFLRDAICEYVKVAKYGRK